MRRAIREIETKSIMKNSTKLISLLISIAAPAFIAWLANGAAFSAETLFGCYTIAGLTFITACSYAPVKTTTPSHLRARTSWIKNSLGRRSLRTPANV